MGNPRNAKVKAWWDGFNRGQWKYEFPPSHRRAFYSAEVRKRMQFGEIRGKPAGTYWVNGYHEPDGTYIEGWFVETTEFTSR